MKRILGLDLGASSIGWAIVDEYNNEIISNTDTVQQDKIVALGSRIIPLTTDESTQYSKGQALTKMQIEQNAEHSVRGMTGINCVEHYCWTCSQNLECTMEQH